MRPARIRHTFAAALVAGATAITSGSVVATTLPEDSEGSAEPDPELQAAIAVFDGRMTDAGFENLGPGEPVETGETEDIEVDLTEFGDCAPEIQETLSTFDDLPVRWTSTSRPKRRPSPTLSDHPAPMWRSLAGWPSIDSRIRSAWPLCRQYSSIMCTRIQRRLK